MIRHTRDIQPLKIEYAELHHFKNGLLSVDEWKNHLSEIIKDEIANINLGKADTKQYLQGHLEKQLEIFIDRVLERIEKENDETFKGRMKQSLMETFIDVKDIKKGIPDYAKAMVKEATSKKNQSQIRQMLNKKASSYMKKTYDIRPNSTTDLILKKYGVKDLDEANHIILQKLARTRDVVDELSLLIVGMAVALFLIVGIGRLPLTTLEYFAFAICLLALLITGVTTPMIDMEARIAELTFSLMNHPITFGNQILFFQSKSVLDVFWIMFTHKDLQMKLVGVLLVSFSVVFPVIKMISTLFYYFDYCSGRKNKIVNFFVIQSGKWSMADVMVVAIFMAFIGFNGIINSQLGQIRNYTDDLDIITTNGTKLLAGYYLFLAYVILAMFFTLILKKRHRDAC